MPGSQFYFGQESMTAREFDVRCNLSYLFAPQQDLQLYKSVQGKRLLLL